MNADVKAKWLAALRGELEESPGKPFVQGTGQLRADGRHCCLGVLCELYRRDTGRGGWGRSSEFEDGGRDSSVATVPHGVAVWAGFPARVRTPFIHALSRSLADLNDNGSSFSDIADIIEAQL